MYQFHSLLMALPLKLAKPDLVEKSAEKGGFNIKSLPAGIYAVTSRKTGMLIR